MKYTAISHLQSDPENLLIHVVESDSLTQVRNKVKSAVEDDLGESISPMDPLVTSVIFPGEHFNLLA